MRGKNGEKFLVFSMPLRIWYIIIYDVVFSLSPCFCGLKCSCLLGYWLHRSCFGFVWFFFFPFISVIHSILYNSAIYFLRWKGQNMLQYSGYNYTMVMSSLCLRYFTYAWGHGDSGLQDVHATCVLWRTALRGLCWLCLSVGCVCVRVHVTTEHKIGECCLQTFPLDRLRCLQSLGR